MIILEVDKVIAMSFIFRFLMFFSLVFLLFSCANVRDTPIRTIQDQVTQFHLVMENTNSSKHRNKNYQSLAYSEMKVYKPASFISLDSVYAIKKKFLDKNDLRGLKLSGIEDLIPGYRAAAQQEVDQIRYEIEHLYETSDSVYLSIYHDYFLFDYKDSLISVTPLYNFKIPVEHRDFYYAYQFGFHFVDDRNLHISKGEQDFIHFFQNMELALIGEEELSDFMTHTMKLMAYSKKAGTVDFREVNRWIIIDYFSDRGERVVIEKFGNLFSLEEGDALVGYEVKVNWLDEISRQKMETTFLFSPYLEIIETQDEKKEEQPQTE